MSADGKTTPAPKSESGKKPAETSSAPATSPPAKTAPATETKATASTTPVEKSDEVCRAFRNTGRCRFKDSCKYVHSEGEPIAPPPRDYTPRGECHNFRDKKECRFADRCRFVHGPDDKRTTYRPERKKDETVVGSGGEEKQICRNFQRRGKCRFGDRCRHLHVASEKKEAPKTERKPKSEAKRPAKKESGKKEAPKSSTTGGEKGGKRRRQRRKPQKEKLVLTEENKYDADGLELCRNFRNKKGKCRFGDDCTFSHAPGGPIGQPAGDRPRGPRIPGPCYNFRDEGKCEFGDECRFKHGDGDKRDFTTRRRGRGAPKSEGGAGTGSSSSSSSTTTTSS